MKLLICDDDPVMLRVLELRLKKDGFTVLKATNGKEAEQLLTEHKDVDLLITDVYMPVVSGLELVSYVRSSLHNNSMIILILTCVNVQETINQALELGANEYWTKPVNLDEISTKIKNLIEHD